MFFSCTRTRTRTRTLALRLAACCALAASLTAANAYSGLYVFGDSLSDIGNVYSVTGGTFPALPAYANGRFSNGPVAVETLALALTGSPLTLSHDFAYGGARTGVSPFPNSGSSVKSDNNSDALNGTGLLKQTDLFAASLGGARADPNALYVVWAGSNDFSQDQVLGNVGGIQWTRMIGNIETAIGDLAADGATHFFVPNVPNLGITPRALARGPAAAAAATFYSGSFDALLGTSLASFDAADRAIDIKTFDVFGFVTTIVTNVEANGSYLGLTDVTSECQISCADRSLSLFWDDLHPTAAAHVILGNAFAAALVPEPETYALMLAGLGVVAWARRRRTLSA